MPMGSKARTAWNKENYTQIKIYVTPELATEFKAVCAVNAESMASVLSQAMSDYCKQKPNKNKKAKQPKQDYTSTRGKRRAATERIADQLNEIRDAEESYRDNIPDNLQNSAVYQSADETVSALDEALEALSETFQKI